MENEAIHTLHTYGYVRVSTGKQDTENQKFEINNFAAAHGLTINAWIEETISGTKDYDKRKLGALLSAAQPGDLIICSELSRLGRSLFMIMDILNLCMMRDVHVWTVKGGYRLGDDIQSKVLAFAFGLCAEIERNLISERTKEALAKKKAEGVKLGRKPGSRNAKVKLTDDEPAIRILLNHGCNYSQIARLLQCDRTTLMRYVTTRCPELAPQSHSRIMPVLPKAVREMVSQTTP